MKNFHFRNIIALLIKQVLDTLKNLQVLVLFVVFPIIGFVMSQALPAEAGGAMFFISLFGTMHCIFAPLVATASIISEEKEKNTLRILVMSNVTMTEYLIAIGSFVVILTLLTGSSYLLMDAQIMENAAAFLLSMLMGSLVSVSFGMCIGLQAANASAANSMAVPFGMVFAFLPMLASFNESIEKFSKFTYGQQISYFISDLRLETWGVAVVFINLAVLLGIGLLLYKRVKTEE